MKIIRLFLSFFAVFVFVNSISLFSADAQEDRNRDGNGKIVRGPYLTNRLFDNCFIGVGCGLNSFFAADLKPGIGLGVDFFFGKWYTPSIGSRLGWRGLTNGAKGTGVFGDRFFYNTVHFDFLWNVSNAFSGYKESRLWNVILYPTFSFIDVLAVDTRKFSQDFGVGLGIMQTASVLDWLDIYIDCNAQMSKGELFGRSFSPRNFLQAVGFLPSFKVGVLCNVGHRGFLRIDSKNKKHSEREGVVAKWKAENRAELREQIRKNKLEAKAKARAEKESKAKLAAEAKAEKQRKAKLAAETKAEKERLKANKKKEAAKQETKDKKEDKAEVKSGKEKSKKSEIENKTKETAEPNTNGGSKRLKKKIVQLEQENKRLKKHISSLKKENASAVSASGNSLILYFDFGSAYLSRRELAHLGHFAKKYFNADSTKLSLTGCADKYTGNAKKNKIISEARVQYVKDILVKDYGIKEKNIKLIIQGEKNNIYKTPEENRVVIITLR